MKIRQRTFTRDLGMPTTPPVCTSATALVADNGCLQTNSLSSSGISVNITIYHQISPNFKKSLVPWCLGGSNPTPQNAASFGNLPHPSVVYWHTKKEKQIFLQCFSNEPQ
jgi:hypothetical protein